MERTLKAAAKGRLSNTGQSCVASKRFIVLAEVYDAFPSGLRDRFAALRPRRSVRSRDDVGHAVLPFGGVKRSGYGREPAELGMLEFANRKLIFVVAPDAPIGN